MLSRLPKMPVGQKQTGRAEETMKTAIATAVNTQGFTGKLHASTIINACTDYLDSSSRIVLPLSLMGQLHKPDGTILVVHRTHEISITNDTDNCVSANTVLFYLDPEDIEISTVETSETLI